MFRRCILDSLADIIPLCKRFPGLMERISPFLRQKCGSPRFFPVKHDFLLPPPGYRQPKIRVRTLLGHCLYRRLIIWTVTLLLLICLTVYSSAAALLSTSTGGILELIEFSRGDHWRGAVGVEDHVEAPGTLTSQGEGRVEAAPLSETNPPHWLKYPQ